MFSVVLETFIQSKNLNNFFRKELEPAVPDSRARLHISAADMTFKTGLAFERGKLEIDVLRGSQDVYVERETGNGLQKTEAQPRGGSLFVSSKKLTKAFFSKASHLKRCFPRLVLVTYVCTYIRACL
jgi:hypothetical protein